MKSVLIAFIFFGLGLAITGKAALIGREKLTKRFELQLKQQASENKTRCIEWANYVYALEHRQLVRGDTVSSREHDLYDYEVED